VSLRTYERYRESGIEWLGAIPQHWDVVPLRHLVDCCDGQRVPLNSEQRADRQGNVPYWGANSIMGFVDEALFDEDLVLLGEDGAPFFDRTRSVAFHSKGPVWPNNHVHVLRPRTLETAKFLTYALNATDYAAFIDGSTRDKLTQGQMNGIPIPWPGLQEQAAIGAFLDRETGKIDALVNTQRWLIDLLKEKRQAVISHAVTKGLDPIAAIKDSGVDWLGYVPAHWEVKKLKHLASLKSGGTPSKDNLDYWSGNIPWASAKDLKSDDLADTIDHITEAAIADGAAQLAPPGSVLVLVRGMMLARAFPVVRILVPMAINQDLKALNGREGVSNEYLAWLLRGTAPETLNRLDEAGHGTKALRMEAWLSMPAPLPPLAEQVQIAAFIRTEIGKLDALMTEAAIAVTLLQERRSTLISAAITGRIDVRGLVPAEAVAA
jgi:type I restriction enzyme S subunit